MKIGFDSKRLFHNRTGLGNYSRDLVRILSRFYPENKYILYNPKPVKNDFINFNSNSIEEINPSSPLAKKMKGFWRSFGISNHIKKNHIEIYHGLSGEIPFGLPKKIKKIVTIHDLIFLRYPKLYSFWDKKIHTYKFKYAAKNSDIIIAISEQTKNDIVRFFDINPEKIKVIYQGCAAVFKENFTDKEKESVRQKLNLPEKYLLNVGTIEPRKNALTILKAIKDIDVPLVLVGKKNKYYQEIENYSVKHNIEDKIIHLSNISQKELAIVYQLATIFVYPSIFEGFGIPIIEALFSKVPVITNKNGVFPEAGGPNSIYIAIDNENEMKEKIEHLLNNPQLRTEITSKGYQFVQKFNDEIIANNIITLYKEVIDIKE